MHVQHIQNAVRGLLQAWGFEGLPQLFKQLAETLRWSPWHDKVMIAWTILKILTFARNPFRAETKDLKATAKRVKARRDELYTYLSCNLKALVDYGHLHRNHLAVSSSRTEGCVADTGNARMGKRRCMSWSQ